MMRMKTKLTGLSPMNGDRTAGGGGGGGGGQEGAPENWEVRPCGMLVQKRVDADENTKPPPTIRVRVKYSSIYHEIYINSQSTFGELKKMLSEPTGLHHEDQKLYYKGKERDSKQFLDMVGVKEKSKLVLMEDPISQEKRYLEIRKNANIEKAAKSISQISLEVDRLGGQVGALESVILKGGKVAEKLVVNLIEQLMNELIKLDGIIADGDVKLQRKMQVSRVQKYVETLDVLKVKNSMLNQNPQQVSNGHTKNSVYTNGNSPPRSEERVTNAAKPPRVPLQPQRHSIGHSPLKPKVQEHSIGHSPLKPMTQEHPSSPHSTSGTVVTTQWETFDSAPPLIPHTPSSPASAPISPKFPWDVFA